MSTILEPIHDLALNLLEDIKAVRNGNLSTKKAKDISNLSAQAIKSMTIVAVNQRQLEIQEKKLVMRNKELIFKEKELEHKQKCLVKT